MSEHIAIYVTGLGDQKATGGFLFTKLFRMLGLEVAVYKMHWADSTPYETKMDGLLQKIDDLVKKPKQLFR